MRVAIFGAIALVVVVIWIMSRNSGSTTTGSVIPSADAPRISPEQYTSQVQSTSHILVDVRESSEVAQGVIPGAVHIPLGQLQSRLRELPKDQTIVVYCRSGNRSRSAVSTLKAAGYENLLDLGGVMHWQGAGYQLVALGK